MDIDTLRNAVVEFCQAEIQASRLPDWWRAPLLVTAEADERFDILPEIAAPNHMRPRDLLASCKAVVEELCLHKTGQDCLKCLQACPVKAISLTGIDRHRCNQRLQINRKRFAAKPGMRDDIEVCAKCVSGMPCDLRSPVSPHNGTGLSYLPRVMVHGAKWMMRCKKNPISVLHAL